MIWKFPHGRQEGTANFNFFFFFFFFGTLCNGIEGHKEFSGLGTEILSSRLKQLLFFASHSAEVWCLWVVKSPVELGKWLLQLIKLATVSGGKAHSGLYYSTVYPKRSTQLVLARQYYIIWELIEMLIFYRLGWSFNILCLSVGRFMSETKTRHDTGNKIVISYTTLPFYFRRSLSSL